MPLVLNKIGLQQSYHTSISRINLLVFPEFVGCYLQNKKYGCYLENKIQNNWHLHLQYILWRINLPVFKIILSDFILL